MLLILGQDLLKYRRAASLKVGSEGLYVGLPVTPSGTSVSGNWLARRLYWWRHC
jgi:hypothetical protein